MLCLFRIWLETFQNCLGLIYLLSAMIWTARAQLHLAISITLLQRLREVLNVASALLNRSLCSSGYDVLWLQHIWGWTRTGCSVSAGSSAALVLECVFEEGSKRSIRHIGTELPSLLSDTERSFCGTVCQGIIWVWYQLWHWLGNDLKCPWRRFNTSFQGRIWRRD